MWTREKPPSCTRWWWVGQSGTRLSREVSPPSAQCRRWWPWRRWVAGQLGKRHPQSRFASARRTAGGMLRVRRPTLGGSPFGPSTTGRVLASRHSLRAVSAAMAVRCSISQRPALPYRASCFASSSSHQATQCSKHERLVIQSFLRAAFRQDFRRRESTLSTIFAPEIPLQLR